MIQSIFAENLKLLRIEYNISQNILAKNLFISQSIISMWENGLREPNMSSLIVLAKYFNVTIDYLVGLEK